MKFTRSPLVQALLNHYRITLGVVAGILLIVGYIVAIGPELATVRQSGFATFSHEQKLLDERKVYAQRLKVMVEKYNTLNQQMLTQLDRLLPSQVNNADVFVIFDDLATRSGLRLTSLTISPVADSAPSSSSGSAGTSAAASQGQTASLPRELRTMSISVTVDGGESYDDFKRFITNIEDSLRLFNVESLTFTPPTTSSAGAPGEAQSKKTLLYTVNLRTYYLETTKT